MTRAARATELRKQAPPMGFEEIRRENKDTAEHKMEAEAQPEAEENLQVNAEQEAEVQAETEETQQVEAEETSQENTESASVIADEVQPEAQETPIAEAESASVIVDEAQSEAEETPQAEAESGSVIVDEAQPEVEEAPQEEVQETPRSEAQETPQAATESGSVFVDEAQPEVEEVQETPQSAIESESVFVDDVQPKVDEAPQEEVQETPQSEAQETPKAATESESVFVDEAQPEVDEAPQTEAESASVFVDETQSQTEETPQSAAEQEQFVEKEEQAEKVEEVRPVKPPRKRITDIDWASLRPEDMVMSSAEVLAEEEKKKHNQAETTEEKTDNLDNVKEEKDEDKEGREEKDTAPDDDMPQPYLDLPDLSIDDEEKDIKKEKELEFTKAVLEHQKGQVKIVAEDENKVLADEDLPTTRALHHSFNDVLTLIGGELDASHFVLMGDGIERIVGISKKIIKVVKESGFLSHGRIARINAKQLNDMDLISFKDQLVGNCLLVDEASELLFPTITKIFSVMDEFANDFVVILADEGKTLDQLFRFAPALAKRFKYIIDISQYTEDDYREE